MSLTNWQSVDALRSLKEAGRMACIIDEAGADALPFTHTLLARHLREPSSLVFLISLREPLARILKMSRRMGHDLNLASLQDRFSAVDCASGPSPAGRFPSIDVLDVGAEQRTLELLESIRAKHSERRLIIVLDGIQRLGALGWTVGRVMRFVLTLEDVSRDLIVRVSRDGSAGEPLSKWLAHRSHYLWQVRSLSSGATKIAHGEVIFHDSNNGLEEPFLFKTTEASLVLHPKETSAPVQI